MYYVVNNIIHISNCKCLKKVIAQGKPVEEIKDTETAIQSSAKRCKCSKRVLSDYETTLEINKNYDLYFKRLYLYCNEYNYELSMFDNQDICIETNIEKWVLQILNLYSDGTAKIVLWHKNNLVFNLQNNKCGKSIYPDYHIQFKDVLTPFEIVSYVNKHETEKWGAKTQEVYLNDGIRSNKVR